MLLASHSRCGGQFGDESPQKTKTARTGKSSELLALSYSLEARKNQNRKTKL
jgi:hypothetical protein